MNHGYVWKFLKCNCNHCYNRRKLVVDEHLARYRELEHWNDVPFNNTPPDVIARKITDPFKMMAAYLECDDLEKEHVEELKRIDSFNTNFRLIVGFYHDWHFVGFLFMLILAFAYPAVN